MKKYLVFFCVLSLINVSYGQDNTNKEILKLNSFKESYFEIPKISLKSYKSVQTRPNQNKNLALGVSFSGGGSRAQFFSTGVMIALDELSINDTSSFLKEIDYISSVSGGGLAAGYYLYLMHNKRLVNKSLGEFWFSNLHFEKFNEKLKIGTKKRYVLTQFGRERLRYDDKLSNTIFKKGIDLGDQITVQSENGTKKNQYTSEFLNLEDVLIDTFSKKTVRYPYLVPNGSIYSNGDRFPLMPHIIKELNIKGIKPANFKFLSKKRVRKNYERSFIKKDGSRQVPYKTAFAISAAFPGILPMVNFRISEKDSVIKVFDGGLIDNLGVETLAELLAEEKISKSKSALIVNCEGSGTEAPFADEKNIKLKEFIPKALLYPVEMNITAHKLKVESYFKSDNIPTKTKIIGMIDILYSLDDKVLKEDDMVAEIRENVRLNKEVNANSKFTWKKLFKIFEESINSDFKGDLKSYQTYDNKEKSVFNLSSLSTAKLKDLRVSQIFMLYELASQVETKLKIEPWEREVLVLAGRYVVYLNRTDLVKLGQY
jgi:Patatin-like phospholipase